MWNYLSHCTFYLQPIVPFIGKTVTEIQRHIVYFAVVTFFFEANLSFPCTLIHVTASILILYGTGIHGKSFELTRLKTFNLFFGVKLLNPPSFNLCNSLHSDPSWYWNSAKELFSFYSFIAMMDLYGGCYVDRSRVQELYPEEEFWYFIYFFSFLWESRIYKMY